MKKVEYFQNMGQRKSSNHGIIASPASTSLIAHLMCSLVKVPNFRAILASTKKAVVR
jgi:hypothetical protein